MATRSTIGLLESDGTVGYIYCHFDGYPEHVGRILVKHYRDLEMVNKLLGLGDLSILGAEIGEKQDFDDRSTQNPEWCLAYGRDRGEKNRAMTKLSNIDAYLSEDRGQNYSYLFMDKVWHVFNRGTWMPVDIVLDAAKAV